jgi:hypothetical protein
VRVRFFPVSNMIHARRIQFGLPSCTVRV